MRQDAVIKFRLTGRQRTAYEAAARRQGVPLSVFVRRALDRAAAGIGDDTVRASFAAVRRHANEVEEFARGLAPEEAARLRDAVGVLRREADRHLRVS